MGQLGSAQRFEVTPLSPTIGAEVRGLDCSGPLDDETVASLRRLWLDRLVLFFPDQDMGDAEQVAFARRFGTVTEGHPIEPTEEGMPEVLPIDSRKDRTNFWHTDVTFMSRPPMGSLLRAVVVPEVGGDTMWSDTRAAYEALAEPLRRMCDGLVGIHYSPYYASMVEQGKANVWEGKRLTKLWPVEHPVVRLHPETGRPNLFVNPGFTVGLKGFPGPQASRLLELLYDHMTQPEFVVRYRWRPGTLAFWDNRATMHFGIYDYEGSLRVMHRVTLAGDRPQGLASSRPEQYVAASG